MLSPPPMFPAKFLPHTLNGNRLLAPISCCLSTGTCKFHSIPCDDSITFVIEMLPVITSTKFLFFFVSFSASYSRQGLPLKVCRRVAQFENQTLLGFMQISLSLSLSLSLASGNFKTKPFLESSQRSPPLKEKRN